jgi:hypothetical protein
MMARFEDDLTEFDFNLMQHFHVDIRVDESTEYEEINPQQELAEMRAHYYGLLALEEATRFRLLVERDRWRDLAHAWIAAAALGWLLWLVLFFTRWP